jgi:branched-chain amino acid aminotransferase
MTIKVFRIQPDGNFLIPNPASTLDLITGALPQGFYTTFSTLAHGTRVLGLKAHLDRLYHPAKEFNLHPAVDENTLRQRIAEIVLDNLPHESRVRLILAKDTSEIFVLVQFFKSLPESVYTDGVHVITSTVERNDPRIKGTDFIAKSAEQRKLIGKDVFEILLTHNGKILEGMTSNFYGVKYAAMGQQTKQPSAAIITAQEGILLGVTRHAVLRIARGQGMSVEYRSPFVNEKFDEAFLTSSSRGVVPIISIDDVPVGQGSVGVWTKNLSKAYLAYVQERSESIVV